MSHVAAQTTESASVFRSLPYAQVSGSTLRLDLFVPKSLNSSPPPLVIWIHGGAWQSGSRSFSSYVYLTEYGFAVASIDYRLTGQAPFPAQIYDCKAAVRWLRTHATNFGYDADKIGAFGLSAGGHLAALLGTSAQDPQLEGDEGNPGVSSSVQAVCDFSGPTDLLTIGKQYVNLPTFVSNALRALLGGTLQEKSSLARQASPALSISPKTCPFFIAHGDQDPVVPYQQSEELYAALRKGGIEATLHLIPGGDHALTDPFLYAQAFQFLQKELGTSPR